MHVYSFQTYEFICQIQKATSQSFNFQCWYHVLNMCFAATNCSAVAAFPMLQGGDRTALQTDPRDAQHAGHGLDHLTCKTDMHSIAKSLFSWFWMVLNQLEVTSDTWNVMKHDETWWDMWSPCQEATWRLRSALRNTRVIRTEKIRSPVNVRRDLRDWVEDLGRHSRQTIFMDFPLFALKIQDTVRDIDQSFTKKSNSISGMKNQWND